jgi:hypothetical protein
MSSEEVRVAVSAHGDERFDHRSGRVEAVHPSIGREEGEDLVVAPKIEDQLRVLSHLFFLEFV